jgi:hypothetical protein
VSPSLAAWAILVVVPLWLIGLLWPEPDGNRPFLCGYHVVIVYDASEQMSNRGAALSSERRWERGERGWSLRGVTTEPRTQLPQG